MGDVPKEYQEGLDRYFYMYADPDTGLLNGDGFRSVLQCLRLCPSEAFVKRVFKEHNKDAEKAYITKDDFKILMKDNWSTGEEIKAQLVGAIKELYCANGEESVNNVKISIEDFISTLTTAGEEPLSEEEASIIMAELKKMDSVGIGKITGQELIEFFQGVSKKENSSLERRTIEQEGSE
ncbi:uncharacterized protein LOC125660376 isoform X2 [Ostrea edulis]|uniref:uncharacterized protein LOC125660376 isoform X2 n=1 Tax=Ostrea edulis TaxID=37623 RepID=UPI0024AF482D|nr:uncharacterized protein LOC125660376 isoform X2 [Ostrea edulis]